jgi:hypothetical protein
MIRRFMTLVPSGLIQRRSDDAIRLPQAVATVQQPHPGLDRLGRGGRLSCLAAIPVSMFSTTKSVTVPPMSQPRR